MAGAISPNRKPVPYSFVQRILPEEGIKEIRAASKPQPTDCTYPSKLEVTLRVSGTALLVYNAIRRCWRLDIYTPADFAIIQALYGHIETEGTVRLA